MSGGDRHPIHVLVVDDSAVVREIMTGVLSQEPGMRVTVASDPLIAMQKMRQQRPDVIILDLEMPRMDGRTFLRKIMAEDPIPVIICSAHTGQETTLGLRALEEGAVDVVTKPRLGVREFLHESAVTLIDAVRAAAGAHPRERRAPLRPAVPRHRADGLSPVGCKATPHTARHNVVAIGASTGGTEALHLVLQAMPVDAPGFVVVQHMPEGFTSAFARRLNELCKMEVKEAIDGDRVVAGRALIAPGNRHMLVRRDGAQYAIELNDGPLVSRHRPSVDVLFRSVAQVAGPNAVGVIMTGMGSDGAGGLLAMHQAGAATIAQDEASSIVFGMPKEAIERGAVKQIAALSQIPKFILRAVNGAHQPAGTASHKGNKRCL